MQGKRATTRSVFIAREVDEADVLTISLGGPRSVASRTTFPERNRGGAWGPLTLPTSAHSRPSPPLQRHGHVLACEPDEEGDRRLDFREGMGLKHVRIPHTGTTRGARLVEARFRGAWRGQYE